jgi:hypothetical protein
MLRDKTSTQIRGVVADIRILSRKGVALSLPKGVARGQGLVAQRCQISGLILD